MTKIILFAYSLFLTILIEGIVIGFYSNIKGKLCDSYAKLFLGIMFASMLTLPYLHFVFPKLLSGVRYVVVSECVAVIVEMIFYRYYFTISWKESLMISFLANCISFLIGVLLFW